MNIIGRLQDARKGYADAKLQLWRAEKALKEQELVLHLTNDYKSLGSNNSEREAVFAGILRDDNEYQKLAQAVDYYREVKAQTEVEIEVLQDKMRAFEWALQAHENEIKAALLRARYNVVVGAPPEMADAIDEDEFTF